jgi:hypothetical protein
MAERMRRAQILFPQDEYRRLKAAAQEQHRSIGSLVREAVAKQLGDEARQKRLEAVRRLASMNAPVADWPQMEEEIMRGAIADE